MVLGAWREAMFVPVLKLGKDHSLAPSYKPIDLANCICKTMENVVNHHLIWVLESRKYLSNAQCGF
jgi:hypothetical protein